MSWYENLSALKYIGIQINGSNYIFFFFVFSLLGIVSPLVGRRARYLAPCPNEAATSVICFEIPYRLVDMFLNYIL